MSDIQRRVFLSVLGFLMGALIFMSSMVSGSEGVINAIIISGLGYWLGRISRNDT